MRKVGVAIVGAGNWARYAHLPSLRLLERHFRPVVIAAATEQSANEAASWLNMREATNRAEDAIAHPEAELVVVLARVPQHADLVHKAIAARKHVYCEWPLGRNAAEAAQMLRAAERAGVRHLVGLQRRLAPSVRWLRQLIRTGFVGDVRSVRLHVSEPYLHGVRKAAWAAFSADPGNFSNVFSIYGGHYLDVLNTIFGAPADVSARLLNQFPQITVQESGEKIRSTSPDQLVMCGQYGSGAALSVHMEGGKHYGSGLTLAVTGTRGDLSLSGASAFRNVEDHVVLGTQHGAGEWGPLPVPPSFLKLPANDLPAAVLEVAQVYFELARSLESGSSDAATFTDAVKLHEQLERIEQASRTPQTRVGFY